MSEPQRPDIHVIEIRENEDGEKRAYPVTQQICDFCADIHPVWDYGCEDFVCNDVPCPFGGPFFASAGSWAACETCAEMIERGRWTRLVARMSISGRINPSWSASIVAEFSHYKHEGRVPHDASHS